MRTRTDTRFRPPSRARSWRSWLQATLIMVFLVGLAIQVVPAGAWSLVGVPVPPGQSPSGSPSVPLAVRPAAGPPTVLLQPTSGWVATTVNASGTGYTPLANLTMSFNSAGIACGPLPILAANLTGGFSCTFIVPALSHGAYSVNVSDGTNTGSAVFTILAPSLVVNPIAAQVGSYVTASGTGYKPGAVLSLKLGTQTIGSCSGGGSLTASGSGGFYCAFQVPALLATSYTLSATDSVNTGSTAFTVNAPTLLLTPSTGSVGSTVNATGSGYQPGTTVSLTFGSSIVSSCSPPTSLIVNGTGYIDCAFTVPTLAATAYTVTASDSVNSASATFQIAGATLSLSSTSGYVGNLTTASGSGYARKQLLTLTFGTTGITVCLGGTSLQTTPSGSFSCEFAVPADPYAAPYTVQATDGTNFGAATFQIVPHLIVTPTAGPTGVTVNLTVTGFQAGTAVTIAWDGASPYFCTSFVTDATGGFTCQPSIPAAPAGPHSISATEGSGLPTANNVIYQVFPALSAVPSQGAVGTNVTFLGTGFDANAPYTLSFAGTSVACPGTTGANGTLVCGELVPAMPGGSYLASLTEGTHSNATGFLVVPALSLAPGSGTVGTVVTLSATGLRASTPYAFCFEASAGVCPPGTQSTFGSLPNGSTPGGVHLQVPPTLNGAPVVPGLYEVGILQGPAFVVGTTFDVTNASLGLTPPTGYVGTVIYLVGSGYQAASPYSFCIQSGAPAACLAGAGTFTALANGSIPISTNLSVPLLPAGPTFIDVSVNASLVSFAPFTLLPELTLSAISGTVGQTVFANGSGFSAAAAVTLMWNQTIPLCSGATTSALGNFSCSFFVPWWVRGLTTVVASTGSANRSSASFTVLPSLTLSPSRGLVASSVLATLTGFDAQAGAWVEWDRPVQIFSQCAGHSTNGTGSYSCRFTVPTTNTGNHTVLGNGGNFNATATFTVGPPLLSLASPNGSAGSTAKVSGVGFAPNTPLTFLFGSIPITSCRTGSLVSATSGGFSCGFIVPTVSNGFYTLNVSDVNSSATATFEVITGPFVAVVSPSTATAPVGGAVTVVGTDFLPNAPFNLTWSKAVSIACAPGGNGSGTTNSTGAFVCTFAVPATGSGPHPVTATQGSIVFTTYVTVVPSITLSPTSGPPGTLVALIGQGFYASNATVAYEAYWGSAVYLCAGTTGPNGGLSPCYFRVPAVSGGSYTVTVNDSREPGVSTSFTVSSTSHPIPLWALYAGIVGAIAVAFVIILYLARRSSRTAGTGTPPSEDTEGGARRPPGGGTVTIPPGATGEPVYLEGGPGAVEPPSPNQARLDEIAARVEHLRNELKSKPPATAETTSEASQEPAAPPS